MAKSKTAETEVLVLEAEEVKELENTINNELVKANITDAIIEGLKEKYMGLTIKGQEDKEGYQEVVAGRKECKSWRVLAKKITTKGREHAIAEQKAWIKKENDVIARISEVEDYLEVLENDYETEKNRIKAEKKQREEAQFITRSQSLMKMGATFDGTSFVLSDVSYEATLIREADEDIYTNTILPKYDAIFQVREAARLETERLAAEEKKKQEEAAAALLKAQQELEAKELALKQESERLEKIRLENEAAEKIKKAQDLEMLWRSRLNALENVGWDGQKAFARYDETIIIATYEELISMTREDFTKVKDDHNAKNAAVIEERVAVEKKKAAEMEELREQELLRIKAEAEAKEKKQGRMRQLLDLGLKFEFSENAYTGYNCYVHYLDITGYDDEKWTKTISDLTVGIEKVKKEAAEQEQKRIEDEKQQAITKALADQKEEQRLTQLRLEEEKRIELEKAGDKVNWNVFIKQLSSIVAPKLKSGQYRKIYQIAKEKIEEIQSLKV